MNEKLLDAFLWVLCVLIPILFLLMFSGCNTTQPYNKSAVTVHACVKDGKQLRGCVDE